MKVSELREKLKGRKTAELQQLIVEMYKATPKSIREEKEIDQLIDNPNHIKEKRKKKKPAFDQLDFETVEGQVQMFIENAYQQNYFAPNRMIPKKERSKWRFTAKRLIDQVMAFTSHPNYKEKSIELYEELYKLFCYASGHYVFASTEPFDTLKTSQVDFFQQIVLLKKRIKDPDEWITDSMELILENGVDYSTLERFLVDVFLEELNNAPLKERAIKIAEDLLRKKRAKIGKVNKKNIEYRDEEYLNTLIEMIFLIKTELGEKEEAVACFQKHYIASRKEIKLYILLNLIEDVQSVEDWLEIYENAIKEKIQPRENLERKYKYIKRENVYPESMFDLY